MERLGPAIKAAGMTQAEFARRLGKAPTEVNRWVKGETVPSLDALDQIAIALNTTVASLLRDDADQTISRIPPRLIQLLESASPGKLAALQKMMEEFDASR